MEVGSVTVNGSGTLLATDSSIINDNGSPGLYQADIEEILSNYARVTISSGCPGQARENARNGATPPILT